MNYKLINEATDSHNSDAEMVKYMLSVNGNNKNEMMISTKIISLMIKNDLIFQKGTFSEKNELKCKDQEKWK